MLELSAPVIAIVGPTASGKTDAAQIVAERLGGEVVSADSMQIYRGMDIGTGKLPASERRVPHHGFDLVDPGEPYSAALFQAFARRCFRDIDARGKRAVLCGGTGQYVQAAIDDFAFPKGDQVENPVRERWTAYAEEHGNQALWEALEARDPASAAVIHPNNVRRVVRAFELLEEGASYAEQKQRLATVAPFVPPANAQLAGINASKPRWARGARCGSFRSRRCLRPRRSAWNRRSPLSPRRSATLGNVGLLRGRGPRWRCTGESSTGDRARRQADGSAARCAPPKDAASRAGGLPERELSLELFSLAGRDGSSRSTLDAPRAMRRRVRLARLRNFCADEILLVEAPDFIRVSSSTASSSRFGVNEREYLVLSMR